SSPWMARSSASSPRCSTRPSTARSSASALPSPSKAPEAPSASRRSDIVFVLQLSCAPPGPSRGARIPQPDSQPQDFRMNDIPVERSEIASLMESVLYEVKRIVVGQDHFLERVLVAMLAQGHLLVEGVPGLAKTLTVKTLARTLRGDFKRIQFTPDLLPADLVGTRMYNQKTGEFTTSLGPVF